MGVGPYLPEHGQPTRGHTRKETASSPSSHQLLKTPQLEVGSTTLWSPGSSMLECWLAYLVQVLTQPMNFFLCELIITVNQFMHVRCLWPEEATGSPGTGVTDRAENPCPNPREP